MFSTGLETLWASHNAPGEFQWCSSSQGGTIQDVPRATWLGDDGDAQNRGSIGRQDYELTS